MKSIIALAVVFSSFLAPVRADEKELTPKQIEARAKAMQIVQGLQFQTGEISILGGKAKIKLTDEFRYLDPANARKVLVDLWHNPPEAGSSLGMIVPAGGGFDWAAILEWTEDGYVKDEKFESTNFDDMLKTLKESYKEQSEKRVQGGYSKLELAGWAQTPHYDRGTHKLYWAKVIDGGGRVQELHYDIRVLGRHGVLELSIMSTMPQIADIETKAPTILSMVDFTDGNRYADFKPGTDKVAAYGIAGLIAGGVLAKAGFFKLAWVFAAKFIKLIIVGVVALFAGIGKLLGKKKAA